MYGRVCSEKIDLTKVSSGFSTIADQLPNVNKALLNLIDRAEKVLNQGVQNVRPAPTGQSRGGVPGRQR